jgi:ABC-type bacteriocin/lantibiotic exporter with double-glycine peptidase domain
MVGELFDNIATVLGLVYAILIYAWAKKQLGNVVLAVLVAVIIVYLTFFQFPELIWVPVIFIFLAFFFSGMFEKVGKGETQKDFFKY